MVCRWLLCTAGILTLTAPLSCQAQEVAGAARRDKAAVNALSRGIDCAWPAVTFPLNRQNLQVLNTGGGILFTAGMTIDADGAPNAYGPHNRGLDYTANARGTQGWIALVTDENGRPVIQKGGRYRGYYVSTTSLEHYNVRNVRNPNRYIDARKVPYIALPKNFATRFGVHLGDLAMVANRANGRSAYAIYADEGPGGRVGEGSIALAKALGIPTNPRHDGVENGITYLVFPGSEPRMRDRVTARSIRLSADRLYRRWGGRRKLQSCDRLSSRAPRQASPKAD